MRTDGLQDRTCRCCGRSFAYPVPGAVATRFHCEDCAQLKPALRQVFERLSKRVTRLEKQLSAQAGKPVD